MLSFNRQIKFHEENNFKFHGFKPSLQLEKTTEDLFKLIESRSPSDSKKHAVLTKKRKGFEARLRVSSASSCSFEIVSQDRDELNSIENLQKKFLDKILVWNKNKKPQDYKFQA